jgi:hypothetical protein
MNRPSELKAIEGALGPTFDTVRTCAQHSAFYSPIPARHSSHVLTCLIEKHCLEWNAMGYTVFVGLLEGDRRHGVFAIFDADPIQLMAVFKVGSQNDLFGHTSRLAQAYMRTLYQTDKFVPYFVAPLGFKVRFVNQVSATRAREIESAVLDFDPDAYDLANQSVIVQTQKLELWWD